MSYTSVEQIKNDFVGKRVKIIEPNHPWEGEIGYFKDVQFFGTVQKWAVIVSLIEHGDHEVAIFSGGRGIKVI